MEHEAIVEALAYFWPSLVQDFLRYFLTAGAFFLVFWVWKKRAWRHLRIQTLDPHARQMWEEVKFSLTTVVIFSLTGPLVVYLTRRGATAIYTDVSERGPFYFALSILLCILFHDAYFYWSHRAMHLPALYARVHQVHHRSKSPTPWAAYSFHPLEAVVEAAFFPVMVTIIPAHPLALFGFLTYMIVRNVLGHLGYELFPRGFARHPLTRWHATTTHHDMHHRFPQANYGLYFTWWDRLMGTTHPEYVASFESHPRDRGVERAPA